MGLAIDPLRSVTRPSIWPENRIAGVVKIARKANGGSVVVDVRLNSWHRLNSTGRTRSARPSAKPRFTSRQLRVTGTTAREAAHPTVRPRSRNSFLPIAGEHLLRVAVFTTMTLVTPGAAHWRSLVVEVLFTRWCDFDFDSRCAIRHQFFS